MEPTLQAMRINRNPLIRTLRNLNLAAGDFVIFGSAPLLAKGLRTKIKDLDVVARGKAWAQVLDLAGTELKIRTVRGERSGDIVLQFQFPDGAIQFSERWISEKWNTDDLIARADVIDGLRFAQLTDVLRYKEDLMRPKDLDDIRALRRRLALSTAVTG